MQRPKGIEITTWLIALALAVEAIQTVILWNSTVALHPTKDVPLQEALNATRGFYVFMISVSTLALFFYWKGRDRARRIILVDCALCLFRLTSLIIPEIRKISLFNEVAIYYQAGLAIYLLGYLFTPRVRTWFTESTKNEIAPYPVTGTQGTLDSDKNMDPRIHRPKGIKITTGLMGLSLAMSAVHLIWHWNIPALSNPKPVNHLTVGQTSILVHVMFLTFLALAIAIVYFYWKGREWARILVLLQCTAIIFGLREIGSYWRLSHFSAIEEILIALFAVFLFWYLFRRDVRAWFAEQTKLATPNRTLKPVTL